MKLLANPIKDRMLYHVRSQIRDQVTGTIDNQIWNLVMVRSRIRIGWVRDRVYEEINQ